MKTPEKESEDIIDILASDSHCTREEIENMIDDMDMDDLGAWL